MARSSSERILAGRPAVDFIGRNDEVERLLTSAASTAGEGVSVLATPGAGASELLRQTYDRLFIEHREIIPFYFDIRRSFRSATEVAESFLSDFIRQIVAFRRQDPTLVRSAAGLGELAELSLSVSGIWIDRLIATARNATGDRDFLRNCFGAPTRAAANGARAFIMIDDVHRLADIDGGDAAFDELAEIVERAHLPFVFAGYRRFLHGRLDGDRIELDNLDLPVAGELVEIFGREAGVHVTEQSRDLIATQLSGNPQRMRQLVRSARNSDVELDSFDNVEKAYADSIFGGPIGHKFDGLFTTLCGSSDIEQRVIDVLAEIGQMDEPRLEHELWHRRMRLGELESHALVRRLNVAEVVRLTASHVEAMTENIALSDYIAARANLLNSGSRASVYGDALTSYIKRATELMARRYRGMWAVGVREVLGAFDGRTGPKALLDYGEFRDEFKGRPDAEVLEAARELPSVRLPRIFFTTAASAFYRPLARIAEEERSAIALGFEAVEEAGDEDVVWIATEIDSKLEASRETTEFWCDRLEAAALMCDFPSFRLWLIAPEGFTPEALDVLKKRNGYGSSRRQVDLLRKHLQAPPRATEELAANEYEIVIPMDGDAELIAAHSAEEIARRHNLDPRSINQIKTALVEACINASEHSLSPDRKIYQRFRIEDDRVVLTVSNRGLRLASLKRVDEPVEGRRGWGLQLIRKLMDEVVLEQVDDGTRIVMTKYLKAA